MTIAGASDNRDDLTFMTEAIEEQSIDRAVNGLARLVGLAGEGLRRLQTGLVRNYALAMFVGIVAVVIYFIVRSVLGGL